MGVFDEYFWTIGYIKQLEYLESKNIIEAPFISEMIETNEFTFFRPLAVIAAKLAAQVKLKNPDKRNQLSQEEYAHIRDFLFRKEPYLREFLWLLDEAYQKGKWQPKIDEYLKRYNDNYLFSPLHVGSIRDHQIFKISGEYYGVHNKSFDVFHERLRWLDDVELAPFVYSAANYQDVKVKIEKSLPIPSSITAPVDPKNHPDFLSMQAQYHAIANSTCWKLTSPIRKLLTIIR